MIVKIWSIGQVRAIARQTLEGRETILAARGMYFRALIETARSESASSRVDRAAQLAVLKAVHRRFYPVVVDAVTTPDIAVVDHLSKDERRRRALVRNRRTNFARSAYGTIRRWLRASGHDLMKLDASKVTKSQLLSEAPPTRPHTLTPARVRARTDRLIGQLVDYAKMVGKADQAQAAFVFEEALRRLAQQMSGKFKATTDAEIAAQEHRPLRVGKVVFLPTERARKAT